MDLLLQDKVALVTGGASGIGEAICRQLAVEGAHVFIADRDLARAGSLADELQGEGHRARATGVELTEDARVEAAIAEVIRIGGGLDLLVNNAGTNDGASLDDGPTAFRASLESNLIQVFTCTHHALPHLKARQGVIVNIGSKVAETGQGGTSGYAASKGGVHALTREWALELASHRIRVNTVVPAEAWTPQYERWLAASSEDPAAARAEIEDTIPYERRMTTGRELADTVAFLASPRSSHTTGQIIHVDGGYTHLDRAGTLRREHT